MIQNVDALKYRTQNIVDNVGLIFVICFFPLFLMNITIIQLVDFIERYRIDCVRLLSVDHYLFFLYGW